MKAIDTIADITPQTASALKSQGVEAVFGYLGAWSKCLTIARVQVLKDAGLRIGSLFEGDGKTFSAEQGKIDAEIAKRHAYLIGQPYGTGICTCVDYDMQPSDYPQLDAYLNAWKMVMAGKYDTGLYAGYDVLAAFQDKADYTIQASAWSNGQKLSGVAAYQNSASTTLCGIGVDIDEVYDTSILWGDALSYPTGQVEFDGKKYDCVYVNNETYPIWTMFRDAGANITKADLGDVEIDGKKPTQVDDTKNTFILWNAVPLFDAKKMWVFTKSVKSPKPNPVPDPKPPDPAPLPNIIDLWHVVQFIHNQLNQGACTGETAVGLREWYLSKAGTPVKGAPEAAYAWSREATGDLNKDAGAMLATTINTLVTHGMAPANTDPLNAQDEFVSPSAEAEKEAAQYKIKDFTMILPYGNTKPSDAISKALAGGDPVGVSAVFNTAFYNPIDGVVDYTKGEMRPNEGHAFIVLGYADASYFGVKGYTGRLYACQNSWGENYGVKLPGTSMGGFMLLTEETVDKLIYNGYTIQV